MPTDFTISLFHRPGALAAASAALGQPPTNIARACAVLGGAPGVYHLLVSVPSVGGGHSSTLASTSSPRGVSS
jgi:hypothetical protein